MDTSWTESLKWVLESEGGNDDDSDDPGGRTSRGITQHEYDAYCRVQKLPIGDVWKAPEIAVTHIYQGSYWMPYCPTLPPGVDYIFFDDSVLSGLHAAVLMLQRGLAACGQHQVVADGHIGLITSDALGKVDHRALIKAMSVERTRVYRHTRGFWKYGRGWLSRVAFAEKNALSIAS